MTATYTMLEQMTSVCLTIAGSDPSGGAGIQADLKTFHQFGAYGEAVVTLLTVQNSVRVSRVEVLPPWLVLEQIAAVIEDIPPAAAKTGALGSAEMVEAVARAAAGSEFPAGGGPGHGQQAWPAAAARRTAIRAMREELLPRATLVTPNVPEAEALTGMKILTLDDMRRAAARHSRAGRGRRADQGRPLGRRRHRRALRRPRNGGSFPASESTRRNTHGTGCTYSAAITAGLASGQALADAVAPPSDLSHAAIRTNPGLGHGSGPVNHHARVC